MVNKYELGLDQANGFPSEISCENFGLGWVEDMGDIYWIRQLECVATLLVDLMGGGGK